MKKVLFILIRGFALVALCIFQNLNAQSNKPNIVLILTDDLGINDVGCYGNAFYETPNLDRLCAEGMKFTHHYSAGAVCSPTRTSIITGKFPARTHSTEVYNWGIKYEYFNEPLICQIDKIIDKDQTFLAEVIRDQGYTTAMFGKWHIDGVTPRETGFDESVINHNSTKKGLDANNDEFHIEEITELTENFIAASVEKKTPFFVVASHHAIHVAQSASTKSREYFEEKGALPAWKDRPELQTPVYAGMMKDLDNGVGSVLTKIDALGISANTLVIFTSDNGGLGKRNFPHSGGKADQYEGGIRVPLIVRWPRKIKTGVTSDEVIVSSDYLRTLASIVGAKINENDAPDSEDFSPIFFDQPKEQRAPIVFHFPHYRGTDGKAWLRPWSVVRSGDYTYIYHWEAELTPDLATDKYAGHELYNVVKDPAQKENLIGLETELADSLKQYLLTWLNENDAQIPLKNPDYASYSNVSFSDLQVGAIRWDAWHRKDRGDVVQQVERSLSPKKYQWRAPFFTEILSDTSIDIKGYDQQVIDQEIQYAAEMGLDYWAFLLYHENTGLNDGLKYYLSSKYQDSVKFCAMVNPSRLFGASGDDNKSEAGINRLIRYFKESSYLMVEGNRPVVYFFRPDGEWVEKFGGKGEIKKQIASLKVASVNAGFGAPYLVVMHYKQDVGKAMASLFEADAFSTYAAFGDEGASGQTYANLTRQTEAFWDGYLNQGRQVIPTVMTGWDRRPRIEHPMSWERGWQKPGVGMEKYFELPSPAQLTNHIKQAAHWLHRNSLLNHPKMLLVYAWNEHDEGGWLSPTINEDGSPNTERLEAVREILKAHANCRKLLPYDTLIEAHSNYTRNNFAKRLIEFKNNPINPGDMVFIGDSHIQAMGDWNQKLGTKNAINRGIGGDITEGVYARLDELICAKPSKVFLLIGTNDIVWAGKTNEELVTAIKAIVQRLMDELPSTTVVVHTVMPINSIWQKKPIDHANINARIAWINKGLKSMRGANVSVIDLAELVSDSEGFLDAQYTKDGVHLNQVGQKVWTKAIKEYL